jgi:nitronate monooxygenase
VRGSSDSIVGTSYFTGVPSNFLKESIVAAGLDPANLPAASAQATPFGSPDKPKVWVDVWGAGQGIGAVDRVVSTRDLVARLQAEYDEAKKELCKS